MATFYIAGFVPEEEGGYSVYFPDVPNVAAGGETIEEAITNAASGLYLALKDLAERNADIGGKFSYKITTNGLLLDESFMLLAEAFPPLDKYILAKWLYSYPLYPSGARKWS